MNGDVGAADGPIATLFPGYFALVMATGILAIGAELEAVAVLPVVLHAVASVAYVVLAVMLVWRIAAFPRRVLADATDHAKGFSFLTVVAGTNVLGAASGVVHGWWTVTWVLWWLSIALWLVAVYTTLIAVVVGDDKPGLEAGINGTWFLLTVSVQSIAVDAGLLMPHRGTDLLAFAGLAAFGLGVVLYLIVMTMVFLRWTFQPLEPTEADPPAWIAAGAVAITVLAGSNLLLAGSTSERLEGVSSFLEGVVVLAWATTTFWFPLMVAIGVWRHIVRRMPLRYHPSYWAMVFPLGMYGVATARMRAAVDLEALGWLPFLTLAVALCAWTVTFVGLASTMIWRRDAPVGV